MLNTFKHKQNNQILTLCGEKIPMLQRYSLNITEWFEQPFTLHQKRKREEKVPEKSVIKFKKNDTPTKMRVAFAGWLPNYVVIFYNATILGGCLPGRPPPSRKCPTPMPVHSTPPPPWGANFLTTIKFYLILAPKRWHQLPSISHLMIWLKSAVSGHPLPTAWL